MTSQSPRIYLYKITFEEVPYYYYGVHREKKYNEKYWGSPKTNKWCWKLYTPKKQILQLFDYTDVWEFYWALFIASSIANYMKMK